MTNWQTEFDADGFTILRSVVPKEEIAAAKAVSDSLWCASQNGDLGSFPDCVRLLKREIAGGETVLDAIQGGHKAYPELQALRKHPSVTKLLVARLGHALVSVVDTLFFKPASQPGTGIAFHRDGQFRKPAEKFRDLNTKYVQIGMPLERHGVENGGLVLVPRSHLDMSIEASQVLSVRGIDDLAATLKTTGLKIVNVEMEPGDLVLWHPQTIHGSPPNQSSDRSRRFFVVGYMAASCCDLGEPV